MDMRKARLTAWTMVVLAALVSAATFFWNQKNTPIGTTLGQPKLVDDVTLSYEGKPWSFDSTLGRWTIVFFGYATCPDVCPTSMAFLRDELKRLNAADRAHIQVAFVSVDPERDAKSVAAYAKNFSSDFLGLTGSQEALQKIAAFFGVHYAKRTAEGSKLGYTIDHNGDFFLIDPFGRWAKLYRPPFKAGELAKDLPRVLAQQPLFSVAEAWVRKPADGITVTGAYLKVRMRDPGDTKLIAVKAPIADAVEIHETSENAGMMSMRQVDALPFATDGTLQLVPGGAHIMLMDVDPAIRSAAQVPVVLQFSNAQSIRVMADVRAN